jgi:CubicO group peptidase (beta-lactamase class C family)
MESLAAIDSWPVAHASAAVITPDGRVIGSHGDVNRTYPLASVTKLITAYAALIAIEEGAVDLDTPAGPEGSTVRHLLAHTSGLAFDDPKVAAAPGVRRIYSNPGFQELADTIAKHAGIPFAEYTHDGLLVPLGMANTDVDGSPYAGASSTVGDLAKFAAELQQPRLLHRSTLDQATTVQFPGVTGILPGYGHQKPNDWGLGFEIRSDKDPHWTGASSSRRTFGHFGQTGTFLWVAPDAGAACVVLTDREFGPWAVQAWPPFTDGVLAEL